MIDNVPGGRKRIEKSVFSDHFYCCEGNPTSCDLTGDLGKTKI
jgi:hypothetical protein